MNVFISWSGQRSKMLAQALRAWLPQVVHNAKPFMSERDLEKGSRGLPEIARKLADSTCGIICVTPENLSSQWLNFEGGALSKVLDEKVFTYLLEMGESEVTGPFEQFQHTRVDKDETKRLVHALHKLADTALEKAEIDEEFEAKWPKLEKKLKEIPNRGVTSRQSVEEMIGDLRRYMVWSQPLGITITSPADGSTSKEQKIVLIGKALKTPEPGHIVVPFVQHGDEFRPNVWIKPEAGKEWKVEIWLMKKGRNTIHIVRPNPLGRHLVSFYNKVHTDTTKWVSMGLKDWPYGLEIETSIDVTWNP